MVVYIDVTWRIRLNRPCAAAMLMLNYFDQTHTPPFYGPFFRDHPGEPVPEENHSLAYRFGMPTQAHLAFCRLRDGK